MATKALSADVLFIGTPVYFSGESAGTRAFLERLLYPLITFASHDLESKLKAPLPTGLIYTMVESETDFHQYGFPHFAEPIDFFCKLHFKRAEQLFAFNTLHTHDYTTLEMDRFDPAARAQAREQQFPEDCARAFALGEKLAKSALALAKATA